MAILAVLCLGIILEKQPCQVQGCNGKETLLQIFHSCFRCLDSHQEPPSAHRQDIYRARTSWLMDSVPSAGTLAACCVTKCSTESSARPARRYHL